MMTLMIAYNRIELSRCHISRWYTPRWRTTSSIYKGKLLVLFSHDYYLLACLPFATTPLFFGVTAGAAPAPAPAAAVAGVVGEADDEEEDEGTGKGVARLEPPLVRDDDTKPTSWAVLGTPGTTLSPSEPRLVS